MMTSAAETAEKPRKSMLLPLLAGVILALALGGGAFWVTFGGMLDGESGGAPATAGPAGVPGTYSYVALTPITINLGDRSTSRHLRVSVQIEVPPAHSAEVTRLTPRILDVLNVYLRALSLDELEEASALIRIRAQMLRRVQIVTGPGRVNDLLVTEFLLN